MQIFRSRFTLEAKGHEIDLKKGEIVKYQLLNGTIIDITIDSERMAHDQCKTYGYEAIFHDNGLRCFADGERIIWWEGKN